MGYRRRFRKADSEQGHVITFAQLLDTPVGTVRGWEQGRRHPPPSAKVLILCPFLPSCSEPEQWEILCERRG